jgi:maleylpyruvate isomerase
VLPGLHKEIEYHHVDLSAGYRPADWPQEFVDTQLSAVTRSMTRRAGCPAVTIRASHATYRIGDGELATVTGGAADLLAWLTGRADGHDLQRVPGGPLPPIPPFA